MKPFIRTITDKSLIADVLDIHQDCLDSLSKGECYRYEIAEKFSKNAIFITAEIDNKVVGFCAFYANNKKSQTAYISMIAVHHEHRGKKIGQLLLNKTLILSKNAGMNCIKLEVRKNNTNAISFYKNNKFEFLEDSIDKKTQYMKRDL